MARRAGTRKPAFHDSAFLPGLGPYNVAMLKFTAFLLSTLACLSAGARTPTIVESLSMKQPMSARISPDGKYVAYVLQETDWEDNEFVPRVWIASVETGKSFALTGGRKASTSPKWSPDSRRIAFLSDRDGKNQIFLISPTGGEASRLTDVEGGVTAFEWSPGGTVIAYTAHEPETKSEKDRKDTYGEFFIVNHDYQRLHLWSVKAPEELPADPKQRPKPEELTTGDEFSVGSFAWSPNGRSIAFDAARDPDLSSQGTSRIYVLDIADKHVRMLVDAGGPHEGPRWSPDGRQIAYMTANGARYYYYANRRIAIVPAEGGTPRVVTQKFDEDPALIDWGPDGLYFTGLHETSAHLFRLNPDSLQIDRLTTPDSFVLGDASFTSDHSAMAGIGAMPNQFAEVCVSPVKSFSPHPLTSLAAQWKDFTLTRREVVHWKSADGTPIQGVLVKPADYVPGRRYPLLVVIHGGPTGVDRPVPRADRYYPIEMFAAKGALVLQPNYRGSAGYGEAFRSLNVRNLGLGDYQDVISGVDSLVASGIVDRDRVGAMGWSEGGYISAFITTYSDRFRAVSAGAGISDWMTYYVNTDIHPFTRQYLLATPWSDPDIYRKTSPITYVNQAKTPTLIQHGDQDKRVPPPDSFELYQALRDRGVPVKLILYKGFGHPITKPKQQRAVMQHNYDWFSQYIWGEQVVSEAGN